MAAMATAAPSPRDHITPEAFRVADHLIGIPLAKPARRLWAMLVDLLLVAILTGLLNAIGFLIAVAGSIFVFRLSRGGEGRWYRRFYRHGLGCFGALLTFVVLLFITDFVDDWFSDEHDDNAPAVAADSAGETSIDGLSLGAGTAVIRSGYRLRSATRPGERDTLADMIVERLAADGLAPADMRGILPDLVDDEVLPPEAIVALEAAIETTAARLENRAPRSAAEVARDDSIAAVRLADARADSAVAALEAAGGDTTLAATRDTVRELRTRVGELEADVARERQLREAADERFENGAVRWIMSSVSDELGLGLGWLGLYFTAFLVLGGGQTPGKKLFRLRVIRLDGRAIGWWTSLQRFGGYSASVFTGLLGFAEMIWDDNRQALQDKLVHTVVIQEPKKGARAQPVDVLFAGDEPVLPPADEERSVPLVGHDPTEVPFADDESTVAATDAPRPGTPAADAARDAEAPSGNSAEERSADAPPTRAGDSG